MFFRPPPRSPKVARSSTADTPDSRLTRRPRVRRPDHELNALDITAAAAAVVIVELAFRTICLAHVRVVTSCLGPAAGGRRPVSLPRLTRRTIRLVCLLILTKSISIRRRQHALFALVWEHASPPYFISFAHDRPDPTAVRPSMNSRRAELDGDKYYVV